MPLTLQDALNAYGFVGQLANAIPELRGIFDQAMREEWVPAQIDRAIKDSPWFRSNAENVRRAVTQQAVDPATYQQNLNNAASKIRMMAAEMGRGGTAWTWDNLAFRALIHGYDEEQIRLVIANEVQGTPLTDGAVSGQAGQIQGYLKQLSANYGVPASDQWITTALNRIQGGMDTLEGYENIVKARAKAQYAHLASQIDAGMTVRDIADPYIASYAQVLEVPETGINLTDPAIQKALQVKDPTTGAFSNKPMHEFVRELKDDPRWDKTKNAQEEAYRMVNRLGKDMGFLS